MSGQFLTNGRWADVPQGYLYSGGIYCPECLIEQMIYSHEASPAARDMGVEEALDQIAGANAIDRSDEYSFDSDEFPKVLTNGEGDTSVCDDCGISLEEV